MMDFMEGRDFWHAGLAELDLSRLRYGFIESLSYSFKDKGVKPNRFHQRGHQGVTTVLSRK